MDCKCHTIQKLPEVLADVVLIFENELIFEHTCELLDKLSMPITKDEMTITIKTQNSATLFETLSQKCDLLDAEKEAINVYINFDGSPLTLSKLSKIKSLSHYCHLADSKLLSDVLENKSLTTYFQPIINMTDNTIFGYECLSRGVDKSGNLIPPYKLFDMAKKSDQLFYLDRYARENALKSAAVKNIKEHIFINFIPTAIYNPELCLRDTMKWAHQLEFDFSKIVFEVVESEKIENYEHLRVILEYYNKQGIKTALDDVGSGYSTLNALALLHPNIIKIDIALIQNIDKDPLKESVFKAIVGVAKEHNIKVLAEGIETKEEFEKIKTLGVDYGQGYFIAKPHPEPVREINI